MGHGLKSKKSVTKRFDVTGTGKVSILDDIDV